MTQFPRAKTGTGPHAVAERRRSPAFREVPRTGVIFVTTEAQRRGYSPASDDWCNLGQGMPEADALPGAPPRITELPILAGDQEYAPVAGLWELREAIAGFYNDLFRRGMGSKYSAENVAVSGGGRSALTRVAASLGHINLGHFLPDYTAYEELLDVFRLFSPIPILLEPRARLRVLGARICAARSSGRGLAAILASQPGEPDRQGDRRRAISPSGSRSARELDCALIFDEFYSHYIWRPDLVAQGAIETAARYVEDVDRDPVVILDGLTKNWRYPGWRVTWTVAPKKVIEGVSSAGSFLDGGGSRPLQRKAIELLAPTAAMAETTRDPRRVRQEAQQAAQRPARSRLHGRSAARGHVLRVGVGAAPAGVDQRRHELLPRRARAQGDHRAGRVLRRRSGQAPRRPRLALPPPPAVLVRPADGAARARARAVQGR